MALNKPLLADKLHYSGTSGGGGAAYGYGGGNGAQVYSSIGHSGYGQGGHEQSYSHKGGKKSIALSALTLLAFLFFLHILQTCLQEQQQDNTTTKLVVMAARTENRANVMKTRKGDDEIEDRNGNIAEVKIKDRDHRDEKRKVVTTRIKTFTKYDLADHV